jgi:hypothetical protein
MSPGALPAKRSFPWHGGVDVSEIADVYVDTARLLSEYESLAALRVPNGHGHWAPLSHLVAGMELGGITSELLGQTANAP